MKGSICNELNFTSDHELLTSGCVLADAIGIGEWTALRPEFNISLLSRTFVGFAHSFRAFHT